MMGQSGIKALWGHLILVAWVLFAASGVAQTTDPVIGLRENTPQVHALINARLVADPSQEIEGGTLIIRDGKIEAVGKNVPIPADARVWDLSGKTVYPGLIDAYVPLSSSTAQQGQGKGSPRSEREQKPARGPAHWNPRIHPQRDVLEWFDPTSKRWDGFRQLGFTAVLVAPKKGIFRGMGALVSLRKDDPEQAVLLSRLTQHLAFERAGFRENQYPSSLMGSIALVRQTLYDARWYRDAWAAFRNNPEEVVRPEYNPALESLLPLLSGQQLLIVQSESELTLLRAGKVLAEFDLPGIYVGSGREYLQLAALKRLASPLILPLNFPRELDVETPEAALSVSLEDLQHWELAPYNPRFLVEAGLPVAFTTFGLKKRSDFLQRVRQVLDAGLPAKEVLRALTETPARILGISNLLGTLEPGKLAHLVVTDGDLFAEDTQVLSVWVDGQRIEVAPEPLVDPRGEWEISLQPEEGPAIPLKLKLSGKPARLKATLMREELKIKVHKAVLEQQRLHLIFAGDSLGWPGLVRLSGSVMEDTLAGKGELPDGRLLLWRGRKAGPPEIPEQKQPNQDAGEHALPEFPPQLPRPLGAYGRLEPPEQPQYVLVRQATLWTCGPQGVLPETDLLVKAGKIERIGKNLTPPEGALVIEARGKHVTPGLIDAHSHTAISGGVNEGTHAVTAEVRIGDVINNSDIDIYRQLAGGLTVANQLHGSANPIGGQNSVIKLRWGADPEEMKLSDAPPGIKFALGENVKQSNWGDRFTTRYPQTRLGVEQIIRDRFKAALDYQRRWQAYKRLSRKEKQKQAPPRLDLQLETLLQVLRGERLVHSHSYRQDEILMLIRVAEDFGFTIGTFQHVLEGYKVAEAIADHGAGASTFSDWWAYKFEVYDAIPYNGALMHRVGVVVSFNSDSEELARRMNTEAAKAIKYGGLSPEEALKFVTINPARQLGIDHRVGSLEPGKDADFVIWSGDPLSTYTICEQTWIDGRKYFDRAQDLQWREQVQQERARLIQKYLSGKKNQKRSPGRK